SSRVSWRSNVTVTSSPRRRVRSCTSPAAGRTRSEVSAAPHAACSSSPRQGWRPISLPCTPPLPDRTHPRSGRSWQSTASVQRERGLASRTGGQLNLPGLPPLNLPGLLPLFFLARPLSAPIVSALQPECVPARPEQGAGDPLAALCREQEGLL